MTPLARLLAAGTLLLLWGALPSEGQGVGWAITRSVVDKNNAEKPAQLQLTMPDEGEDSYAVDGALSLLFPPVLLTNKLEEWTGALWESALTAEYHRNNQTDKEQDTLVGSFTVLGVVGDLAEGNWTLFPRLSLKYKSDEVKNTKSGLLVADLMPALKRPRIGREFGPAQLRFLFQPSVGTELERVFEAKDDEPTGTVVRAFGDADLRIFPLANTFDERLEFYVYGKYWNDISESGSLDDRDDGHELVRAGVTVYFDNEKRFGLGFDRVNGENPTEGLPDQTYDQISFKVKITVGQE